jgi:hypothetical protein
LTFLGLLISATAFAADENSIGSVIMVQGQAYANNVTNVKRTLQRRSDVYLNDTIVTLADSRVQLRLNDDSIITLQPLSKFVVNEFSFDRKDPKNNHYVGSIVQGALIDISGQGKPENYQLKSPLAVVTFRGTGLMTRLNMKGGKVVSQDLKVFKGYVTVQSICDEERRTKNLCRSVQIDVGVGQPMSAVTIDASGNIQEYKGPPMENTLRAGKTMTENAAGGVSIQCKSNQ